MGSLDNFQVTISGAGHYISMYKELRKSRKLGTRGRLTQENEDLLWLPRAAIVISISALDWYIHSVMRSSIELMVKQNKLNEKMYLELMKCFKFNDTKKFKTVYKTLRNSDSIVRYFYETRIKYSTFQNPRNIEEAFQMIGIGNVFLEVSRGWPGPNRSDNDIKNDLRKYVKRRDQIVHEGDMEVGGEVRHIQPKYAEKVRDFVNTLVNRMDSVVIAWGSEFAPDFRP